MPKRPPQADLLPADVRAELAAASRIRDPLLRQVTLQQATERAQKRCPELYQTLSQPPLKEQSK